MKKTFFLLGITLCALSCKRNMDCCSTTQNSSKLAPITLNGVDSAQARNLKTNYSVLKSQDSNPLHRSVWFDSATFHHMVALLLKERGKANPSLTESNIGQTDGMRIYFVSGGTLTNGHLQTSIVLVSTKNNSHDATVHHSDYYTHDLSDPLFANLPAIKGEVETKTGIHFSSKELKQQSSQTSASNPHHISKQSAYEMQNYYGTAPATTISMWLDIELLATLDQVNHDGIRLYFARHKPLNADGSVDKEALKETLVLVPTILKGGVHADNFMPVINNATNGIGAKTSRTLAAVDSSAYDRMELCPNNCDPK